MTDLERCKIPECTWHVESSRRGLCFAHEAWRASLGAGVVSLRPVPTAEQILRALRRVVPAVGRPPVDFLDEVEAGRGGAYEALVSAAVKRRDDER